MFVVDILQCIVTACTVEANLLVVYLMVYRDEDAAGTTYMYKIYSSDEREPAPLALHHCPLAMSFAVFSNIIPLTLSTPSDGKTSSTCSSSSKGVARTYVVIDPSAEEERVMDGRLYFSINAHQ